MVVDAEGFHWRVGGEQASPLSLPTAGVFSGAFSPERNPAVSPSGSGYRLQL